MKAMVIEKICDMTRDREPLALRDMPEPEPQGDEVVLKVSACGVCHTELDEIEGRTPPSIFPMIPGHQVVGEIVAAGSGVTRLKLGDRVGIAWVFSSCRKCRFCEQGLENLCDQFKATGRDAHGGYAQFAKVGENFAFKIPEIFTDSEAAPLLCAGAIGFRSLRLADISDGENLGLTGFGASAHLVLKMAAKKYPGTKVFVFARNPKEREFARELGAVWAGDTAEHPPELLDAVIDTTPAWKPVVEALSCLAPDGRLVVNAIRKENRDQDYLLKMDYAEHLWMEKEIKSVANVAPGDVEGFLALAAQIPIRPEVQEFSLEEANRALMELKEGKIRGAKVLRI